MDNLTFPQARSLSNSRSISCAGYTREDGLYDIEAHLIDTKPTSVFHPKYGNPKPAGTPLHEMKIRVSIDSKLLIHKAEAVTIAAPFGSCEVPPLDFSQLRGISLQKGWKKAVEERMGGTRGCTHLRELLASVATMAFQTIASSDEFIELMDGGEAKLFFVDSCLSYDKTGEVVKTLFPEQYESADCTTATADLPRDGNGKK